MILLLIIVDVDASSIIDMTYSKSMLATAIDAVCGTKSTGMWTLRDVLAGVTPAKANDVLVNWLDANCSNGHFSHWTSFGNSLYNDFIRVMDYLHKTCKA